MLVLPQRKPQTQEEVVVGTSALSNYDLWQRNFFFGTKKNTHTVQPRGIGPFPICPEPPFENEADNESFGYFLSTDIFVAIVTLAKTMAFHFLWPLVALGFHSRPWKTILFSWNFFPLWNWKDGLTLYALTSVCIFSILFIIHFLRCWQGEFVCQSKGYFPGDHFLYSHDLNVWFKSDIVGRN